MRWVGHAAWMGDMKSAYSILARKPEGKNHLEDLGVDEKIKLELILGKWDMDVWTGYN
jgi:hypothetical protein